MERKWFRIEKRFLNSWFPASLEGWIVTLGMALSIAGTFLVISQRTSSPQISLVTSFPYIALIMALTILVVSLTGEKPHFGQVNLNKPGYNSDDPLAYLFLAFFFLLLSVLYLRFDMIGASLLAIVFPVLILVFLSFEKPSS